MEKVNRWILQHAWLAYFLMCATLFLFVGLIVPATVEATIVACIVMLLGFRASVYFVFGRSNVLLKKPMEILCNQCDPYPFQEETQRQCHCPGPSQLRLQYYTFAAMGLCEIGEYRQAYDLLMSVRDTLVPKVHPNWRLMYYTEMYFLLVKLQMTSELELLHNQVVTTYDACKKEIIKQKMKAGVMSHFALYHRTRGEYGQALEYMQAIPPVTRRDHVVRAMALAQDHWAMGEVELAREKLQFVIENGNKLYVVTEAKALLEKIHAAE